jgi:hypothetical protein
MPHICIKYKINLHHTFIINQKYYSIKKNCPKVITCDNLLLKKKSSPVHVYYIKCKFPSLNPRCTYLFSTPQFATFLVHITCSGNSKS